MSLWLSGQLLLSLIMGVTSFVAFSLMRTFDATFSDDSMRLALMFLSFSPVSVRTRRTPSAAHWRCVRARSTSSARLAL